MFKRKLLSELEAWSKRPNRKPLILRGARQVGKTSLVNTFGRQFKQYIYLNLENELDKVAFNTSIDIHMLTQSIFLFKKQKFAERGDTLLFIDEIQEHPAAINMLRYFYEDYPELRVIAAASLFETIFGKGLSYPVGGVEYMVMHPVSFPEFLGAMDQKRALEQLENIPVNEYAHITLLQLYHTYALIGGMPAIVQEYAANRDLTSLGPLYDQLIAAYLDDAEKYGGSTHMVQVIRHCIRVSFTEAGRRIKFQHFGQSAYGSKEVGEAMRTLEKTFLLSLLYPSISATLPLMPDYRKSPRLHVLDTGMMNYFLGIQREILDTSDLDKVHQGTIIEHLAGQELLASQFNALSSLNFWVREKKTSTAEVDYVYPFESQLIPVEVKSGKEGTLRSLHLFMDQAPHDMAIRLYAGKLMVTQATTPTGKTYRLLNLPYYLASQAEHYMRWLKHTPISADR